LTLSREVIASIQQPDVLNDGVKLAAIGMPSGELIQALSGMPDDSVLLCTSNYRFFRKTIQQLARLNDVGLDLADAEGFQADVFGNEYVSGLSIWNRGSIAEIGVLVTISGYYRSFKAEPLIARLEQSVPYQPARLKGDPFSLITAQNGDHVVAFSANGRAACVSASVLAQQQEGRLISLSSIDQMIAVLAFNREQNFLLASEEGAITVVHSTDIPMAGLNTTGTKVFTPRTLKSALPWDNDCPVWIVTSDRLLLLDPETLENNNTSTKPRRAVKLAKGETLVGLIVRQ
jgi:DNA gyrase/topoisomerase IV subunit A